MSAETKISCRIAANAPGLTLWVGVAQSVLFHGDPVGLHDLSTIIPDDDAEHEIKFILSGKTMEHTKIDQDGNIIEDTLVTISDLAFDDIQLGHIVAEQSIYEHDFNGTGDTIQDEFYGTMGCNGQVSMRFTTPIYLWLLEKM